MNVQRKLPNKSTVPNVSENFNHRDPHLHVIHQNQIYLENNKKCVLRWEDYILKIFLRNGPLLVPLKRRHRHLIFFGGGGGIHSFRGGDIYVHLCTLEEWQMSKRWVSVSFLEFIHHCWMNPNWWSIIPSFSVKIVSRVEWGLTNLSKRFHEDGAWKPLAFNKTLGIQSDSQIMNGIFNHLQNA